MKNTLLKILMHTVYKRKKALFLVTLFCMNSWGSFIPAMNASSSENISSSDTESFFSNLDPRIQTVIKGKEKEYNSIIEYYEYRGRWSVFYIWLGIQLVFSVLTIPFLYKFGKGIIRAVNYYKTNRSHLPDDEMADITSYFLIGFIFGIFALLSLYRVIVDFRKAKYPGAVFLTDTGVLYINCGYNAQYQFIPYTDIKTVNLKKNDNNNAIEIKFVKNFIEYERKGIKYSDKVNTILIEQQNMPKRASYTSAFQDLYVKVLGIVERIHMVAMREKAREKSTQEKEKSLLEVRKKQETFIDRLDQVSDELYEKAATVELDHPGIFKQIEAYYPYKVSQAFIVCVVVELVLTLLLVSVFFHEYNVIFDIILEFLLEPLITLLITFGLCIYALYDSFMHPSGLFMTDTGFLFIEEGKKLQYTFIGYEHIEELLCNVNEQALFISNTSSTHEVSFLGNGIAKKTTKIKLPRMEKEIFDTLNRHLQLKMTVAKMGKSRLSM